MEFFLRRCLAKPVFEFLSLGFVGVLHVKKKEIDLLVPLLIPGPKQHPWTECLVFCHSHCSKRLERADMKLTLSVKLILHFPQSSRIV